MKREIIVMDEAEDRKFPESKKEREKLIQFFKDVRGIKGVKHE